MDLSLDGSRQAFRSEAREWLEANRPRHPLPSMDTPEGFEAHRRWERVMHDAGWAVVQWPVEYGGRGVDLIDWLGFEEEYYAADAPGRVGQNGIFMMGPTLMEFGTAQQKARFLPPMASGDHVWCQGWSEPNAGSDLASLRTRARPVQGGYIVSGSKIWVSRGAFADWMFALVRTGPEEDRHRTLTFMVLPLDAPGITVRPIRQIDGRKGFAEVFMDEVEVPADQVIGEEGSGWRIAMATAAFERGILLRSPGRFLRTASRLVDLASASGRSISDRLQDRVVRSWMEAEAYRLHTVWLVSKYLAGGEIGPESSMNKVYWSEMDVAMHETALDLLQEAEVDAGDASRWIEGFLFSLAGPIYAGTNQIQRNIVADRVLRLPRSS